MTRNVVVLVVCCLFPLAVSTQCGEPTKKPSPPEQAAASPEATATPTPSASEALPATVSAAFKKAYPNAIIKEAKKKKKDRDGKGVYEVDSVDGVLARNALYLADGVLLSLTEDITQNEVPPAVAAALKTKYSKETVKKRKRIVEGRTVQYKFSFKGETKPVLFTPEGKVVT